MSGPLTYLSNGLLIGKVYQFKSLSLNEQKIVLAEVIRRYQIGNNLGGSAHRMQHIIGLCKEIVNDPLLKEEQYLLRSTRFRFGHIETIEILNLCILYWSITQDSIHKLQLQGVIQNVYSPIREAALLVHRNYPNLMD